MGGKSFDSIIGDVLGAGVGGLIGSVVPGIGTVLGASLGGALGGGAGSAVGGGNLGQDVLGAAGGAALGYGGAELAGAAGLGDAAGAAAAGGATDAGSAFGNIASDASSAGTYGAAADSAAPTIASGVSGGSGLASNAAALGDATPGIGIGPAAANVPGAALGAGNVPDLTSFSVAPDAGENALADAGTQFNTVPGTQLAPGALPNATNELGAGLGQAPTGNVFTGAVDSTTDTAALGGPDQGASVLSLSGTPTAPPFGGVVDPNTGLVTADTSPTGAQAGIDAASQPVTAGGVSYPNAGAAAAASTNYGQGTGLLGSIGNAWNEAGGFLSSPSGRLVSTGVAGAGLLRSLTQELNPNPIPGMSQLSGLANSLGAEGSNLVNLNAGAANAEANQATAQAQTLENYLTTGTLPPAVQTALDQATQQGITQIQAQYAARGMPPGSSSELQDINALRQNSIVQGGSLAASLYSQGVTLDQLSAQIYTGLTGSGVNAQQAGAGAEESLVSTGTALNTAVNTDIGNLAFALGGGTKLTIGNGNTVTVPQAA